MRVGFREMSQVIVVIQVRGGRMLMKLIREVRCWLRGGDFIRNRMSSYVVFSK